MDKRHLRQTYSKLREELSTVDVERLSQEVSRRFISRIKYSPRHILSYQPMKHFREISPRYIEEIYPDAQITYVSQEKNAPAQTGHFDMIIVPMIAGDRMCHRLGFGGGWYDTFLAGQPHSLKVGLCYDPCVVEVLPHEQHDIPLDYIVTDKQVIHSSVE